MEYTVTLSDNQVLPTDGRTYLREIARAYAKEDATKALPLCFAFGRLKAINAILAHRHNGPCRGGDANMFFGLMLPYSVEIAHLRPVAGFKDAMRRYRWWLPGLVETLGEDGIGARWDELCQERSISKARFRTESAVGHVDWLPTAERIACETGLTYAERAAINARYPDKPPILGIPVIDPPTDDEKRELDRLRKEAKRRADGVVPQSERNKMAEAAAMAKILDCDEGTVRRNIKAGTLDRLIRKRLGNAQKVSAPSSYTRDGQKVGILAEDPEAALWTPESEAMAVLRELLSAPSTAEAGDAYALDREPGLVV